MYDVCCYHSQWSWCHYRCYTRFHSHVLLIIGWTYTPLLIRMPALNVLFRALQHAHWVCNVPTSKT
jgi:hypothetical protein